MFSSLRIDPDFVFCIHKWNFKVRAHLVFRMAKRYFTWVTKICRIFGVTVCSVAHFATVSMQESNWWGEIRFPANRCVLVRDVLYFLHKFFPSELAEGSFRSRNMGGVLSEPHRCSGFHNLTSKVHLGLSMPAGNSRCRYISPSLWGSYFSSYCACYSDCIAFHAPLASSCLLTPAFCLRWDVCACWCVISDTNGYMMCES